MPDAKETRSALSVFLNAAENTKTREKIFFHRLHSDLCLAAARAGYGLTIFEPEVDRDGYDIVIDDKEITKQVQLKCATESSRTGTWYVPIRFFLPTMYTNNEYRLGFPFSPEGTGQNGGIIVTIVDDADPSCSATYLYTDLYVLTALEKGLLIEKNSRKSSPRRKQARTAMDKLRTFRLEKGGPANEKLQLPRGVFLKLKSAEGVLGLAGFRTAHNCDVWRDQFAKSVAGNFDTDEDGVVLKGVARELQGFAQMAASELSKILDEPDLLLYSAGIGM